MSTVEEEILAVLEGECIEHYGMPRRSGRYPYGSGDDPYQHGRDFLGRVEERRKENFTFKDDNGKTWTGDMAIAKSMGLSATQFRTELGIAKSERRALQVATAKRLKEKEGLGATEIGRQMGLPESTVRSLLNEKSEKNMNRAQATADLIKKHVDEKGMIDVGKGVERELGISKEKLDQALYLLERQGYPVYGGGIPQPTNPGQQTNQKVICKPGTEYKEIYDYDKVHTITDYQSRDGGETFSKFQYPASLDSKRIQIRYADDVGPDGFKGIQKDGVVEIRRGVKDLSLGGEHYSQVRILVDGTHYIKGMAVYSDDLPDGVDIMFNTNKKNTVPMKDVLKEIKNDPDNPFGALIKPGGQSTYIDSDGTEKLSLINKTRSEGDWSDWKDKLPAQFLAKQSYPLAKKQLDLAKADKLNEYDDICALNNPTIKKHLLEKFADECDSSAVNLQAAALPGQKYHVILPINSLKDTEVYAPRYENGTKLALVRYPHGGLFEIPVLTVNNKNKEARNILGTTPSDGIGITSKVAEQLSGADFDGDTVMCIPTDDQQGRVKIARKRPLKDLEGFDSKQYKVDRVDTDADGVEHGYVNGNEVRLMSKKETGTQMGIISNLITDMTLAGADEHELARAVKHSMVVIDAHKHKLDYKQSELDNNIPALHKAYQGKASGGASTIISKAKGRKDVVKRQGSPKINLKGKEWYDPSKPEGSLVYTTADDAYYTKTKTNKRTGETIEVTKTRHQQSTKMAETDDPYTLVSKARHPMELLYADYADSMKKLGRQARLEMVNTGKIAYSKNAATIYQEEVKSLMNKLNIAQSNTPKERAATRMAAAEIKAKKLANPNMDKSEIKKASQVAITKYRNEVGSISRRDRNIDITDKEWEAIQAGAISESKLKDILDNTDIDSLRDRATPRARTNLSPAKINTIKRMRDSNYTLEQIAKKLGVSTSAVSNYLKGEK
jgi:predicted transcriptional regulator